MLVSWGDEIVIDRNLESANTLMMTHATTSTAMTTPTAGHVSRFERLGVGFTGATGDAGCVDGGRDVGFVGMGGGGGCAGAEGGAPGATDCRSRTVGAPVETTLLAAGSSPRKAAPNARANSPVLAKRADGLLASAFRIRLELAPVCSR